MRLILVLAVLPFLLLVTSVPVLSEQRVKSNAQIEIVKPKFQRSSDSVVVTPKNNDEIMIQILSDEMKSGLRVTGIGERVTLNIAQGQLYKPDEASVAFSGYVYFSARSGGLRFSEYEDGPPSRLWISFKPSPLNVNKPYLVSITGIIFEYLNFGNVAGFVGQGGRPVRRARDDDGTGTLIVSRYSEMNPNNLTQIGGSETVNVIYGAQTFLIGITPQSNKWHRISLEFSDFSFDVELIEIVSVN